MLTKFNFIPSKLKGLKFYCNYNIKTDILNDLLNIS